MIKILKLKTPGTKVSGNIMHCIKFADDITSAAVNERTMEKMVNILIYLKRIQIKNKYQQN